MSDKTGKIKKSCDGCRAFDGRIISKPVQKDYKELSKKLDAFLSSQTREDLLPYSSGPIKEESQEDSHTKDCEFWKVEDVAVFSCEHGNILVDDTEYTPKSSLDGYHFGDRLFGKGGAFWWRKELRKAFNDILTRR